MSSYEYWYYKNGCIDPWRTFPPKNNEILGKALENYSSRPDFQVVALSLPNFDDEPFTIDFSNWTAWQQRKPVILIRHIKVNWRYLNPDGEWVDYDFINISQLEAAYQSKYPFINIILSSDHQNYTVDIKNMTQTKLDDPKYVTDIRRVEDVYPRSSEPECKVWKEAKKAMEHIRINPEFLDSEGNTCFCDRCFTNRRNAYEVRGVPEELYAIPIGWCRFGVAVNKNYCDANDVFEKWHVCYHGTSKEGAKGIIFSNSLLLPGDTTFEGFKLGVVAGHITKTYSRVNKASGKDEIFDPNQIFVSPTIEYSSYKRIYTKPMQVDGINWLICLQLRIQPHSYTKGHETVSAGDHIFDIRFKNEEIEWYTKRRDAIVITGLLIKKE